MKIKLPIFFLLVVTLRAPANLYAQDNLDKLSREGTLTLLRELDTLINNYTKYCSFLNTTSQQKQNFISLFESEDSEVFDDINPNISPENINLINENYKGIREYIEDIEKEFSYLNTEVKFSDVASAAERVYRDDNKTYFLISVEKTAHGGLKDTMLCKTIRTESDLVLWVRLYDTITYQVKISQILKEGPLGVDWDYSLASIRRRKMETHFNLKPLYSFMYPYGFREDITSHNVVVNENKFLDNNAFKKSGITSNGFWGSAGINGDIEFRFVWDKPGKSKHKGFSIGIGGGIFNSYFHSDEFSEIQYLTDRDGDPFYSITNIEGLNDSWLLVTGDIPIIYSSEKWKGFGKGRYFSLGARLSYVNGFARGKGMLTHTGYYPGYGVVLSDITDYGFISNKNFKESYTPNINPFNVAFEMSFGRKIRSRSGNSVFYIGLNAGAYLLDFLESSSNEYLMTPDMNYRGVLPMNDLGRMAYVGIDFGILKADPNENLLKRKEIVRSNQYSSMNPKNYNRLTINSVQSRDFSAKKMVNFNDLRGEARPLLFNYEKKNPLKVLDKYIRDRINLSTEELLRIKSQGDFIVYFNFVIDSNGKLRDLRIMNQQETEYGQTVRSIILLTAAFWQPGNLDGIPVDTKIYTKYQF